MQILAVDIGTGTQDIYLYDSNLDIENGYKLIVPSPTMMVHRRISSATRRGDKVLLTGCIMGGGPSQWAAENHLKAGHPIYATEDAARSFNDDLDVIKEMGIQLVEDEGPNKLNTLKDAIHIELQDFDFATIEQTFDHFGVKLNRLAAVAAAVFDHGDSPPGFSDRQFRFDYLDERIRTANRLSAFAYRAEEIPPIMTRLQAVARNASGFDAPFILMDTAPAAVLGATFDPKVRLANSTLVTNVGNMHTLAFRLGPQGIEGVFEHHTGLLDQEILEKLIRSLAAGTLTHDEVFGEHGHGALVYVNEPYDLTKGEFGIAVTGPRRNMLTGSPLRPYFTTPFGDMMIAGCFGLLAATADLLPDLHDTIMASLLASGDSGRAPWDAPIE
jgi:uncharacterized protein (DUF1786 family)